MDPVLSKIATNLPDPSGSNGGTQAPKNGSSKFDRVSNQVAGGVAGPSSAHAVSSPSGAQPGAMSPSDRVNRDLAASQNQLSRLKNRVGSTPELSTMRDLEGRLSSLEHQYAQLDQASKALPPDASRQQLLLLQQQVYSMNEGIGTLSKIVGEAASGVKTILQTQV
jgi:hypothetical protein